MESIASSHVEEGGGGEERSRLPYSTLWTMQLAREEQSHQEACDKYAEVSHPVYRCVLLCTTTFESLNFQCFTAS